MPAGEDRLLERARSGDEAAFAAVYQRYRVPVFRFAWRLTGSVAVAEDVTQECFLALISGAGFDSRQGGLCAYLLGITRHLALKRIRLAERETNDRADSPGYGDPLSQVLDSERAQLVRDALSELPVLQREALVLFEYEEMSLEEIAAITSAHIGAVKSRLHRARESLRRRLAPLLAADEERKCS